MQVAQRTGYGRSLEKAVTTSDAVMGIVANAPDYYDGEAESQARKLAMLTRIVAAVVESLPEDAQLEVLNTVSYAWEKAPGGAA